MKLESNINAFLINSLYKKYKCDIKYRFYFVLQLLFETFFSAVINEIQGKIMYDPM
jgi:hypothetical protein